MSFVDPRQCSGPEDAAPVRPAAATLSDIEPLRQAIRGGRFYEVEDWIRAGHPLQVFIEEGSRSRPHSPLQIAIDTGQFDVVRLLLCNGIDLSLEMRSPLSLALRSKDIELVNLLLDWGVDPTDVSSWEIFDSYDRELIRRFWNMGYDFSTDDELAGALSSGNNKPLFGFVRAAQKQDRRIRHELNRGLVQAVKDGREKGVSMCLWAGADPHETVATTPLGELGGDEREDDFFWSAMIEAVTSDRVEFLKTFGIDHERDPIETLVQFARSQHCRDVLVELGVEIDWNDIADSLFSDWILGRCRNNVWAMDYVPTELASVFERGGRINTLSVQVASEIRKLLLHENVHCTRRLAKLLQNEALVSNEVLRQTLGNPKIVIHAHRLLVTKATLARIGIEYPSLPRPTLSPDELEKIEEERRSLFQAVWSKSVEQLAAEECISGNAIRKRARRLQVPLPPRGYWAKKRAGKPVPPRPKLKKYKQT